MGRADKHPHCGVSAEVRGVPIENAAKGSQEHTERECVSFGGRLDFEADSCGCHN